ncbi:MAG TPA: methyltransferase domain-containing protein [Candidatus Hydrogenedentes bacterium]|nr:methyltransferase domain-containing protein [Candidatus Hydrogenedentota bacterium]
MALGFRIRDLFQPPLAILHEVGLTPSQTVLDFGCGPGAFSIAAAEIVGPEGRVFAIDVNPLALAAVRHTMTRKKFTNITTLMATDLDHIPPGTVDVAIVYDVLHELPDPASVLAEIYRLTGPRGLLTVSDHHMSRADIHAAVASTGLFVFTRFGFRFAGIHCFRKSVHA